MNSATEIVSAPEAVSASAGPSTVSSALASATAEDKVTDTMHKTHIRRGGHAGPIFRFKLYPSEDREARLAKIHTKKHTKTQKNTQITPTFFFTTKALLEL